MHSLCVAELHAPVNSTKMFSVAQLCFCGEFLSPAKIKRTEVHHVEGPVFLSDLTKILIFPIDSHKSTQCQI